MVRSAAFQLSDRLARKPAGRSNAARGAAVMGSLSSAAAAWRATGASMQSKK